jgi:transposase InsO family protein
MVFSVGGTEDEDIRFNRVILLDLMYLTTPTGTKPVLHVMDRDTRFHAASFLRSISASDVWNALIRCWVHTYAGIPTSLLVDSGSQLKSDEFKGLTQQAGITLHHTGVEAHNSLGLLERYHDAIRRVYEKVTRANPTLDPEMALSCAVKAANDITGPNGICPTTLLFGIYPAIDSQLPPNQQSMDETRR